MEADRAQAERREPGRDVLHCPGVPEVGTDPRTRGCPAAETRGCPAGLQSRAAASSDSHTSEADMVPAAGRLSDLTKPEERRDTETVLYESGSSTG